MLAAAAFYLYNSGISHFPSYSVRHFYLRRVLGLRLGSGSAVHMGCFFTGRDIEIGNNSVVNRNCYLDGRAGLRIGNNASISPECYLLSLDHDPQSPEFACVPGPVSVEDYVWLGARVMVLPGVRLARGSVVGAGAVVTKSSDPYTIVAGVPAKKISERNSNLQYTPRYFPFFNSDIQ